MLMNRFRIIRAIAVVLLATMGAMNPQGMFAQATNSAISGVVHDQSQAVVAGASITVTNTETGLTRTRESDGAGRYRVGELPPGTYQISITMPGFSRETRRDIVLQVGQELGLNFTLQVGALEQEVVVTGEAPVVETSTATVARVVSGDQLRELPLNGRSFTDLITLDTMAAAPSNQSRGNANFGGTTQLTVAGARSDGNSFTLDGTDMNATSNNTPGGAAGGQLGVDTVREFQVITSNAKAEYGRNSGAIINAVTRSGTNDLHGSLFEFLRNSALDARRFIDLPSRANPEGSLPPFKRNQFGGTLGGPVRRDKSFYFLAYEGLRQRLSQNQVYNVPTADGRRGIGVLRTGETVDSRAVPYLNLYPLPNAGTPSGGIAQFITPLALPANENFASARYDHHFSENDFLFARYTISRGDNLSVGSLLSETSFETRNQYLTLQYDRILGPTLLNMFRAGFNRSFGDFAPNQVPGGENLGFTPGQPVGQLSSAGLSVLGPAGIVKLFQVQNMFQFDDQFTVTRGAHTMKFGAALQRFQWNTDQPAFIQGSIAFGDLRNFLLVGDPRNFRDVNGGTTGNLGQVGTTATFLLPGSSTYRHLRTTLLGFFAQDDWRVSNRLTLNYGLRWEFHTGLNEIDDLVSYIPDPLSSRLEDVVTGELWDNRITNFQPRLGFNFSLDSEARNVLSGGFGIFHNQVLHNSMVSFRAQLPFYFRGTFANITQSSDFPNIRRMIESTATGVDVSTLSAFRVTRSFDHDNFKTPTFYRYNLTLQRALPAQMVARVGYVGAVARHLARRQSLNTFPQPITQADGSLFFPGAPARQFINPNFSQIEWMSSDVNSSYNALTANLQKQFSRGVSFQASYTWSKCIDDASSSETNYGTAQTNGQYSPDRVLERARCNFNIPHSFVFNGLYELPFGSGKQWLDRGGIANSVLGGWQLGGVVTIQQGVPFTVTSSARTTGFAFNANRPNVNAGVDIKKATQGQFGNRDQYFDTSIFNVPAAGTIGNAPRNLLLGPPLTTVNLTLSKSFAITERTNLQFRSEFFNVFNQTNLGVPLANVFQNFNIDPATGKTAITPNTGKIQDTSTTARQIQLALKLTF